MFFFLLLNEKRQKMILLNIDQVTHQGVEENGIIRYLKDIFVIKLFSSTAHCNFEIGNYEKIENAKLKNKNYEKIENAKLKKKKGEKGKGKKYRKKKQSKERNKR